MRIKVKEGQTLFDIAVQVYGSIGGFWWLLQDNGLNVDSEVLPGTELLIRDGFIDDRALYFRATGKEVNNSDTYRYSENFPLTARVLAIKNEAAGADGFIRLDVHGGRAPYFYLWSNGVTTKDLLGATAGTYSVTVEDSAGKRVTVNAAIGTENTGNWLVETESGEDLLAASGDRILLKV